MSAKINSYYVENYAKEFSNQVCDRYFSQKKYMTGHEIITLTPSPQVNFFIIKTIFEAWKTELEKLKSNPFFDYRDKSVHEALKEFMNVLSRTIKIERLHFEPLINQAVGSAIHLAVDPLRFYLMEIGKVKGKEINQFLKDNKKYYKWHVSLIANLIDRAGLEQSSEAYQKALETNFQNQKANLEGFQFLLNSMGQVQFIDFEQVANIQEEEISTHPDPPVSESPDPKKPEKASGQEISSEPQGPQVSIPLEEKEHDEIILDDEDDVIKKEPLKKIGKAINPAQAIDPLQTWARFESEEYSVMKGTIIDLTENVGLNQRFMFTKELFEGNPDLMHHALKSIDQCESFIDAIHLINERFVAELNWDKNSEAVGELLQLVFRKFDQKG